MLQRFTTEVRDRRSGQFPDEWLEVIKARKHTSEDQAIKPNISIFRDHLQAEHAEGKHGRRLPRPGCVPWEPGAPRALGRRLSPRPFEDGANDSLVDDAVSPNTMQPNEVVPTPVPELVGTEELVGSFIWQPRAVAQKVCSA